MKKISSLILFLFSLLLVKGQVTYYQVSGRVIDVQTQQPMAAASVFAQNTTIGTATDDNGRFTLTLPGGGYDLVVSFTGYQVETRRIAAADAGTSLQIGLRQKEKELQDVVIRATSEVTDGWEKYGSFFLDNFIGKTANSAQCSLLNKEVLKFYFSKKRNRLKIMAAAPLEIENKALGYIIHYTLDSFVHEYSTQVSIYSGYPLFEEMKTTDPETAARWKANREQAYHGSMLHFMRSLYHKQLTENGFEVQFLVHTDGKETAVAVKDLYGGLNYSRDDSTRTVEFWPNQPEMVLLYKKEQPDAAYRAANPDEPAGFQLSLLSFAPNQSVVIEQNGYYFEQNDITINQYLAWEKVADMLPYDYLEYQ